MNDDTEPAICPICGKAITVVLDWEDADYSVGLFGGWIGGISTDDTACFKHMSAEQSEDVVEAAIMQRDGRDRARIEAEIHADLDAMYALAAFNAARTDVPVAGWTDAEGPF
jgi:hypothetical protein